MREGTYTESTLFVEEVPYYLAKRLWNIRLEGTLFTYYRENGGTLEWVHDYDSLVSRLTAARGKMAEGTNSILNVVAETKVEGKGKSNDRKHTIVYTDPGSNTILNGALRRKKLRINPAFKLEGIAKKGPHGGSLRWGAPNAEWAVWEKVRKFSGDVEAFELEGRTYGPFKKGDIAEGIPDAKLNELMAQDKVELAEISISQDQIRYFQEGAAEDTEVSVFAATKTFDILEGRPMDDCGFKDDDDTVVLGTTIPHERLFDFAPDPDKNNATMEQCYGDGAFKAIAERLEHARVIGYFPLVKRKGMTVHLACLYPVRRRKCTNPDCGLSGTESTCPSCGTPMGENKLFAVLQTFGGRAIYDRPLEETMPAIAETKPKPVLKKATFKKVIVEEREAAAMVAAMPHQKKQQA